MSRYLLAFVVVLVAGVFTWQVARAQDPNNPPYDPHPLGSVPNLQGGSAMTVSGQYLYVLKGNKVYRIKTSAFAEERPRAMELP